MLAIEHPPSAMAAQAARQRAVAAGEPCAFVGGGTALQLGWGDDVPAMRLIHVAALPEAQGISLVDGQLRIGAAVRLESLRRDPQVAGCAPLLAHACSALAALSVRHLGTLGGNVGWGFGDCLPALLVMDAEAELADGTLEPLCDLQAQAATLPLLVAIRLDAQRHSQAAGTLRFQEKIGHRAAFSPARINLAMTAIRASDHRLRDVRIAAGAAGVRARRLRQLERQIEALAFTATVPFSTWRAACEADLPGEDTVAGLASNLVAGWLNASTPT